MSDRETTDNQADTGASSARRDARAATRAWVAGAATRLGVSEATVRRWIRAGRLNPSCNEVYSKLFPYLDRELSAEERTEVDRHIAACPGCEDHFAFDGTVLQFTRQRAPRALAPSDLQERLLAPFRGRAAPEP